MSDDERTRLRGLALAALARREHSQHELARKLRAKGGATETVTDIIDTLSAQRLQSDDRYAQAYIHSRAERGYGPQRIAVELRTKGLNEELAEQCLDHAECDWYVLAKRVDHKKFGANPGRTFEELAKRRRFLEYRGFTPAQIKQALSTVDDE